MSMARLVITAVTVEGRSKSEVARDYGVSRVWVQKLVRRYQREGPAAFEPRSRRPHSNPWAVNPEVEDQIVRLRKTLTKKGMDAGAETIAAHLQMAGCRGAGGLDDLADLVAPRARRPAAAPDRRSIDRPSRDAGSGSGPRVRSGLAAGAARGGARPP